MSTTNNTQTQAQGPTLFNPDSDINETAAYRASFGEGLPSGTIISDPLGVRTGEEGYDLRPQIREQLQPQYKALDDLMSDGHSFAASIAHVAEIQKGLTTSDYQLPVYPLEDMANLTRRNTPFWDTLPKISSDTLSVTQDSITDLATPQIGGETAVPPDTDTTYTGQSLPMTYYRITGSVSGPMGLASAPVRNAQAVARQNKAMAMGHFSANLTLNGDPTTGDTSGGLTDERGYAGARTIAIDNGEVYAPQGGTGGTITVNDVRQNIRRVVANGGSTQATAHFTDLKTIQDLKDSLDETNQVVVSGPRGEIQVGAPSVVVDGTPVMHSDFMPDQPQGTANPTGRELLSVDMRFHSVHDLSSLVMEPLAKISDADRFFMKRYSVYMVAQGASQYMALIQELA